MRQYALVFRTMLSYADATSAHSPERARKWTLEAGRGLQLAIQERDLSLSAPCDIRMSHPPQIL